MSVHHSRYWFAAKRYGWGWGLPRSWQGWVVLAIWLAVVVALTPLLQHGVLVYSLAMLGWALVLLAVCWWKGEPPRWRWG